MNDNKEKILNTDDKVVKLQAEVSENKISDINESIDVAKQMRIDACEEITEMLMEWFVSTCGSYGIFNNPNRFDHRDLIMVENAICAALYRHYGLEHPLHEVTNDMFNDDEDENEQSESE